MIVEFLLVFHEKKNNEALRSVPENSAMKLNNYKYYGAYLYPTTSTKVLMLQRSSPSKRVEENQEM